MTDVTEQIEAEPTAETADTVTTDAAAADAATADAEAADTATADTATADTATADTATADAGTADTATPGAETTDAETADAATVDIPVVEVTAERRVGAITPTDEVARTGETTVTAATVRIDGAERPDDATRVDEAVGVDDATQVDGGTRVDDATRVDEAAGVDDATRVDEATRVGAADPESDRTTVVKPGSGRKTVAITPTELRAIPLPSGADIARWSGRSSLPPPAPTQSEAAAATPVASQLRAPTPASQEPDDDGGPSRRPQVLPWLAALAAVVLVAVLIFGIWLIYRALDDDQARPNRTASASPVTSSAAPSTSSRQSSPRPTSESTSYVETPALVVVPPVQGTTEEAASGQLRELGFQVAIRRKDSTAEPGTVLGVDPVPGTSLPVGSVVTLTVAKAPASPSPRPSATSQRTFSSSSTWWSSSWSMG